MNLQEQLAYLESAQLIRRAEGPDPAAVLRLALDDTTRQGLSYLFKHTLTQETAYGSLLLKRRRDVHRRVAECVEQLYADQLDDYAALLAQHYAEAGDDPKTLEYATRAGDAAMRIYANLEAVTEFTLALEVAERASASPGGEAEARLQSLYVKRGRALELLSRFDDAARNYDEMEKAALERGDRSFELAALIAEATVRAIPGSARDPELAQLLSDRALDLARELGDRKAEAKILWNMLLLSIYAGGDAQKAVAYGERSLAIAREFNLREQMAYTMHDLFVAYAYLGEIDKAETTRLEAGKLWRELDNQPMLAESLSGLSMLRFLKGEFDPAISLGREAFQISQSIGNLGGQGFSGYTLGLIYLERGEIDQAVRSFGESLPITEAGGLEGNGISPYAMLGLIYGNFGDTSGARDLLHKTFARASTKLPLQRVWLYSILTRVELLANDLDAAEAAFAEGQVVPSMENFGRMFPAGAPHLYLAECELSLARREFGRAIEVIDALLAHLHEIKARAFVPEAMYLRGLGLLGQGNTEAAIAIWRKARSEANDMGSRRVLSRILVTLSRVEGECGNGQEAAALRAEARACLGYIADHSPPELRGSFLNLPEVGSILNS